MVKTKQTLFVIFAGAQQQVASATCYIAQDASSTMMRSKAARFDGFADAKQFAEKNHIVFNALTYIGLEDFTDLEMQDWERSINKDQTTGASNDDTTSC